MDGSYASLRSASFCWRNRSRYSSMHYIFAYGHYLNACRFGAIRIAGDQLSINDLRFYKYRQITARACTNLWCRCAGKRASSSQWTQATIDSSFVQCYKEVNYERRVIPSDSSSHCWGRAISNKPAGCCWISNRHDLLPSFRPGNNEWRQILNLRSVPANTLAICPICQVLRNGPFRPQSVQSVTPGFWRTGRKILNAAACWRSYPAGFRVPFSCRFTGWRWSIGDLTYCHHWLCGSRNTSLLSSCS